MMNIKYDCLKLFPPILSSLRKKSRKNLFQFVTIKSLRTVDSDPELWEDGSVVALPSFFFLSLIFVLWLVFISLTVLIRQTSFTSALTLDFRAGDRALVDIGDKSPLLTRVRENRRRLTSDQVNYLRNQIKAWFGNSAQVKRLSAFIVQEATRADVDPLFVASVIRSESRFNHSAVSHKGARGLMQIMPATGKYLSNIQNFEWKGIENLHDPQYNIKIGIAYLKYLDGLFKGNWEYMLIAYNWGPANLADALRKVRHIPESSRQYARDIIARHKRWRADFDKVYAKSDERMVTKYGG